MNNKLLIILFLIPFPLLSNEIDIKELIEIDVLVKVENSENSDIFTVDVTKYTISNRSVNIKLKGYDGELFAYITPILQDNEKVELYAKCEVKSLEGEVIKVSDNRIETDFDEKIMFYPLGSNGIQPRVIMELTLKRFIGI